MPVVFKCNFPWMFISAEVMRERILIVTWFLIRHHNTNNSCSHCPAQAHTLHKQYHSPVASSFKCQQKYIPSCRQSQFQLNILADCLAWFSFHTMVQREGTFHKSTRQNLMSDILFSNSHIITDLIPMS